ncbi:hypothetical protein BC830DRAFT_1080374 [Chytriomyces sp. MP71]|nr:hypothetical protein BC830DRAFT_1080374 [Chytriomyces sp. MP71]
MFTDQKGRGRKPFVLVQGCQILAPSHADNLEASFPAPPLPCAEVSVPLYLATQQGRVNTAVHPDLFPTVLVDSGVVAAKVMEKIPNRVITSRQQPRLVLMGSHHQYLESPPGFKSHTLPHFNLNVNAARCSLNESPSSRTEKHLPTRQNRMHTEAPVPLAENPLDVFLPPQAAKSNDVDDAWTVEPWTEAAADVFSELKFASELSPYIVPSSLGGGGGNGTTPASKTKQQTSQIKKKKPKTPCLGKRLSGIVKYTIPPQLAGYSELSEELRDFNDFKRPSTNQIASKLQEGVICDASKRSANWGGDDLKFYDCDARDDAITDVSDELLSIQNIEKGTDRNDRSGISRASNFSVRDIRQLFPPLPAATKANQKWLSSQLPTMKRISNIAATQAVSTGSGETNSNVQNQSSKVCCNVSLKLPDLPHPGSSSNSHIANDFPSFQIPNPAAQNKLVHLPQLRDPFSAPLTTVRKFGGPAGTFGRLKPDYGPLLMPEQTVSSKGRVMDEVQRERARYAEVSDGGKGMVGTYVKQGVVNAGVLRVAPLGTDGKLINTSFSATCLRKNLSEVEGRWPSGSALRAGAGYMGSYGFASSRTQTRSQHRLGDSSFESIYCLPAQSGFALSFSASLGMLKPKLRKGKEVDVDDGMGPRDKRGLDPDVLAAKLRRACGF